VAQQQQHDQAQESIDALVAELQDTMDKMQELSAERADTHKQVGTLGSLVTSLQQPPCPLMSETPMALWFLLLVSQTRHHHGTTRCRLF
jgi:hypothetical protein